MKIFLFIVLFVIFPSFSPVYGQENSATGSSEIMIASQKGHDYILPYPGILPTSPVYKLKAIRDQLVSFLISDTLKRAEFDLLQADKRLNAGLFMFNSKPRKEQLIIDVISKAENYFSQAIAVTDQAKAQGQNTQEITNKMVDAAYKHFEVIQLMEKQGSPLLHQGLKHEQERVASFILSLTKPQKQ